MNIPKIEFIACITFYHKYYLKYMYYRINGLVGVLNGNAGQQA